MMPTNDPAYQKQYKDRHYAEKRHIYVQQTAARKAQLRAEIQVLKEKPCADCGVQYPYYVMDFDHRDREEKVGDIARMVANGQRTAVFKEVEKCDVVCSNCHRERTHQRRASVV